MAFIRTTTAQVDNSDLEIRIRVSGGELHASVAIVTDGGTKEVATFPVASVAALTNAERTGLTGVLRKLRDNGLAQLGYADDGN